jgi:hypothetical protein
MYKTANKPQAEMTASPDKYPQGKFRDKECKKCQSLFSPKAPSHLYCSQECADYALSDNYLVRTYNITLQEYLHRLEEQDHKCKICNSEGFLMDKDRHKIKLVVDHDHKTGKVRGLLCHNCNRALGLFQDNPNFLNEAVTYLGSK